MATVKRSPNGKKWRARWYDPSGKECAKDFDLKRDANRHAADMEASKARGQYVDPNDKTTVAEYARRWASARPHKPRTAARTDSVIRNHIEGTALGGRRMSTVLPSDVQTWATGRSKVLASSTLASVVGLLSSVFKAAALDRVIGVSPVVNVTLPEAQSARIVPLTVEQVRELADAMPDRCRAMVITQAGLGLRVGELLALRVQDVDFLRRSARVELQLPPGSTVREEPKTPLSKRPLPLPDFVAAELAEHIRALSPLKDDGGLFHTKGAKLWLTASYLKVFRKAVKAAGLPEGTTSHDLRHHYASVLLHAGESVVAVAERLGHKDATLVLKTYGHLMPDSEERTRSALDAAWRDADQVRTIGTKKAV